MRFIGPGEPRLYATQQAHRNARIATALGIAALAIIVGAPNTAADDTTPTVHEDGTITYGPCAVVDAGRLPPNVYVDVWSCIPV